MKSKKLLTILRILIVIIAIAGCRKDDYQEIKGKCPVVVSTNPANGALNVPTNQIVTVTFNERMDPATITDVSFTLSGSIVPGTVTYTDSTATFTSTSPLIPDHTYTGRVTTAVKDLMGLALQTDYVWTFSTGTILSPVVISVDPVNSATGIVINKVVSATFSMKMDPLTIVDTTFILKQGTTAIAGTVSYVDSTATFTPSINLLSGTLYTATITTGARNVQGKRIVSNYIWSFTTGTITAPTVILTDPASNALGIALNKIVTANFSVPMDPLTITAATVTVKIGATAVPGIVSYSGTAMTFTPSSNLLAGTTYTATITTGAKNVAGIPLANNYVWTFTTISLTAPTVILTDPLINATGVVLNKTITATFSMPMNSSSITTTTFTLKNGATSIAGIVSYTGTTASFAPSASLLSGTTYTATITTGVKNLGGVPMVNNYVWKFTTGTIIAPTVISTDPVNFATAVVFNKTVAATFSVAMDPSTINTTTFTIKQGVTPVIGLVSYTGTTASFTPSINLLSGTTYTATISTGAKNLAGIPLANNYVWTFTTLFTPPTVISTDPVNLGTTVVLNKVVNATFSVPMNSATITSATFTLKQGATTIAGTVSYTGSTASFTPTVNLLSGTVYTATITTGAKNLAGIPLVSNYVWTFTTLTLTVPTVISTDPVNLSMGVVFNKIITANFNMAMNPLTITSTTFTVYQGATPVLGTVSYAGTTATFTPSGNLVSGTNYTATITAGAKNLAGTPLSSDYIWTFTTFFTVPTVVSTDPVNLGIGVALNKIITATFSVPMNPLTITGTTFTVKQGVTSVSGTVTYSGLTATFTPTSNLLPGTAYTATITTGAKNVAGTPLASSYVWTFNTITLTAPTVISTDPLNGATGVALNKIVTASFSVAMDPLTITSLTFTLKLGVTPVAGTVTYTGTTASFAPTSNLISDNTYTATITVGAKNVPGTPLALDYVWTFSTKAHTGPLLPDLKTVGRFGIISGVGVSNNAGFSIIYNMDVGISPGARSSVTGFPPATIVNGAIYASDDIAPPGVPAMLIQAKLDLTAVYLYTEGAVSPAPATVSGDQGGKTLAPGIYKSTSTLSIQSGDLTLDAQGDINAVWIFQIASGFTTVGGAGGNVILTGGAQAKNVFWQVGSSATIGDYTSFYGTILALTSITMNSHATAVGRMLCRNGAVVLTSTNIINKP